jgi:hypothetical protein
MKRYLYLLVIPLFWSCEKNITIDLKDPGKRLVVEATIENEGQPTVFLSNSLDFFGKISPEVLQNSFVHDAMVEISDGINNHRLKEFNYTNDSGNVIYYYSNNPSDPIGPLIGKLQTNYSLNIQTAGKNYQSSTTIPSITRQIDSIWWEPVKNIPDSNKVKVIVRATDKKGYGDYIRYFTKTNDGPFLPGFTSVYDDQVIDGTTYTVPVDKGADRNIPRKDTDAFFDRGDHVILKLCNIDKATYDFWRTFEFSFQSIGNPFSSPTKVTGNITNGALGYFGGYASQFRDLTIPPR